MPVWSWEEMNECRGLLFPHVTQEKALEVPACLGDPFVGPLPAPFLLHLS